MLAFKEQNCELTLAEGLEIYLSYLKENNKKIGTDGSDDDYKIWQCHDCTHVIFGNGVTFEEESINDLHGLILCSYEWKDYLAYFKDPFLSNSFSFDESPCFSSNSLIHFSNSLIDFITGVLATHSLFASSLSS